jgi:hypothetical protein
MGNWGTEKLEGKMLKSVFVGCLLLLMYSCKGAPPEEMSKNSFYLAL